MIHQHVMQRTQVARAERSHPIVIGHWALFSLLVLWLTVLASAFNLGLNFS
jgi:hypothetical protein